MRHGTTRLLILLALLALLPACGDGCSVTLSQRQEEALSCVGEGVSVRVGDVERGERVNDVYVFVTRTRETIAHREEARVGDGLRFTVYGTHWDLRINRLDDNTFPLPDRVSLSVQPSP